MLQLEHRGGDDVERELEDLVERLENPPDKKLAAALVRQNAGVNFDPDHRLSVLHVENGRGEIGSEAGAYADLLTVDEEELADIIDDHLGDGDG